MFCFKIFFVLNYFLFIRHIEYVGQCSTALVAGFAIDIDAAMAKCFKELKMTSPDSKSIIKQLMDLKTEDEKIEV
jgi:hypothetical protein